MGEISICASAAGWILVAVVLCTGISQARDTGLPWQVVTAVMDARDACAAGPGAADGNGVAALAHPARTVGPDPDYALKPRQTAFFGPVQEIKTTKAGEKPKVEISRWQDSAWKPAGSIALKVRNGQIQLVRGISGSGFFRICLSPPMPTGRPGKVSFYALVSDNWKKDLILFCQNNKRQIEMKADPELVRSCLAASHWDHVMGLAGGSQALTGKILRALGDALEGKQAFESGKYPQLVTGLNKLRLKRFRGALTEEFVIFVPDHPAGSKALPLVVHCDKGRFAARDRYRQHTGYVDLWWHTVTDKDVDWKSYQAIRDVVGRSVNIDPDRVYVTGDCMNALAAMSLALNYPDHWAECCISLGNTYRHLAGNAWNLPFILYKGGHNEAGYNAYFDFAIKCFEYHRCPHFKGNSRQDATQLRGGPLPQAVRERSPQRVSYTIESLHNPTAYWATIEGREDENHLGNLDARVEGQTIHVTTGNVEAYRLDLARAPVDSNRPVQIVENGGPPEAATGPVFVRRSEKYCHAERVKTSRLSGPLCDAFTDAYIVVWGNTGGDGALVAAGKQAAQSLAGQGPCFADTDVPEFFAGTHNLVLVGTPQSNRWLAKIDPFLPVRVVPGQIIAGDMQFRGPDLACMVIYPDPFNAGHYVAVYSGTSAKALAALPEAYAQMKKVRPADVGVFEVTRAGQIKWHILERFDATWNWHRNYDRPLMTVRQKHPAWQWQQWLAALLRRQLGVEALVYEEPFLFENTALAGQVTYRDLFNSLRNYWMIQVDMSGADLRKMATAPFANPANKGKTMPVIDGVTLAATANPAEGKVLSVSELQDDRMYKAALSEQCIKGEPLGVVPQRYEITGQVYLIPTLAAFLEANRHLDVDAELDRLQFKVF